MWIKRRPYFRKSRTRKPPGVRWCSPKSFFFPTEKSSKISSCFTSKFYAGCGSLSLTVSRMICFGSHGMQRCGTRVFGEEWRDDLESRRGEVFGYNAADFFSWIPFVWVEYFRDGFIRPRWVFYRFYWHGYIELRYSEVATLKRDVMCILKACQ